MAKKQSAMCTKCRRPAAPGHVQCRHHLNYFRQYRKARRDSGLCIHCGADSQGYQLCRPCGERSSAQMRDRYYARRKAGLCVACGKASGGYSLCDACTLRKARRRGAVRRVATTAVKTKTAATRTPQGNKARRTGRASRAARA